MPAEKITEFIPRNFKIARFESDSGKSASYSLSSLDDDPMKHCTISLRREYGNKFISATIYTNLPTIEKQTFELYELEWEHAYTGWSNQKRWLFRWAKFFKEQTDHIAALPNNQEKIAEAEAEIERLQKSVKEMRAADAQVYKDAPLPPFVGEGVNE